MVEALDQAVADVAQQYHRLVLVVGPVAARTLEILRDTATRHGLRYLNLNLELSRRLQEVPVRQRPLVAGDLAVEVAGQAGGTGVVLANTELLFEPSLQINPLACLQQLSRHHLVVASWNGRVEGGALLYATVDHPEYRRYPLSGLTTVSLAAYPVNQ